MNRTQRLALIDAIYAHLPRLECRRQCQASCGPVHVTPIERGRIVATTGAPGACSERFTCPLLREGGCRVYEIRPAICRLWGLVEAMRCPWGCVPERWLSDEEAMRVMRRVEGYGAGLVLLAPFDEARLRRWLPPEAPQGAEEAPGAEPDGGREEGQAAPESDPDEAPS